MTPFQPKDPDFQEKVRESFKEQAFMRHLQADITRLEPGMAEIHVPYQHNITQQDGFLHAGVVTALVDTACGCAAHSLMPPNSRVLSVEFKVNLMSPARGDRFRARGDVIKAGRTLTICNGQLFAEREGEEHLVAAMQATMICISSQHQS